MKQRHPNDFDFQVLLLAPSDNQKVEVLFTGDHEGGAKLWQVNLDKAEKLLYLTTLSGSYTPRPEQERKENPLWGFHVRFNDAGFSNDGNWLWVEWDNDKISVFHKDRPTQWTEHPENVLTPKCNGSCFMLSDGKVRSLYNDNMQLPGSHSSKPQKTKR